MFAHLPSEFFERFALRLKRLHQCDPVAEPVADAVLDQFVHHGVGQPVALRVKAVQNQLPLDQLFQTVIERVAQSLLEQVRLAGIFLPQRLGRRRGEILDFRKRDDPAVHHGLDAINQFRVQRQTETKGRRQKWN